MIELKGIIPAIATPFHDDETLNLEELRRQVERQIAAGANALFCLGTNGEFYALSVKEKKAVIETVAEQTAGRVPVMAGTGCITTAETIEMTRFAQKAGADVVSIIVPYFAGITQEGIYEHFVRIADACDIPVTIYNNPARTGVNVHYSTLEKMAQHEQIVGIKDSSGNFDNTLRYIESTSEDFIVLCGNDSLILWTLLAGGKGGISGIANIFPEIMVNIYKYYLEGDLKKAKEVQDSVRPIRDTMSLHNPNSIVKRAANLWGQPLGPARAPFNVKDAEIDRKILAALELYR